MICLVCCVGVNVPLDPNVKSFRDPYFEQVFVPIKIVSCYEKFR